MRNPMTPESARRALLGPTSSAPAALWEIAEALDKDGAPLPGGASPALIADILLVHEVDTWPRTARGTKAQPTPFQPFARVPRDGVWYRSFIPDDIKDEDEQKILGFAEQSKNPVVRSRVFHVLCVRFPKHAYAKSAYEARFEVAAQLLANGGWTEIVANLGHLTALLLKFSVRDQFDALFELADKTAAKLIASDMPFSFPVLADVLSNTILVRKPGRDAFTKARADKWADDLQAVASKYQEDPHHGHDALIVLQDWYSRWGNADKHDVSRRRVVEQLLDVASVARANFGSSRLIQKALQIALDYGISDLTERCRLELMRSIKGSAGQFKTISGCFQIPAEMLEQLEPLLALATTPALAVRELAVLPGILEIDRERVSDDTKKMLEDHPLLLFTNSAGFHREGKVIFNAIDPEGNTKHQIGRSIGFHLVMVEAVLQYILVRIFPALTKTTLVEALAEWPYLPQNRWTLLGVAAERFASEDWVSSGFIVATLYESVLRDLVRSAGYSALKIEPGGVQMDETLNSLLRADPVRQLLGDTHCDFVEFALCDSAHGWNMRNEIAHGTVRPDALSPTRVFMTWLLIVRLTCYVSTAAKTASTQVPSEDGPPGNE